MTILDEEKENKRRILELKSEFDKHMDMLDQLGEKPKTMRGQLKEFLSTHTAWLHAYSNVELATLFYDFTWGTNVKLLSDAEKWRRYLAIMSIRNMIAKIRIESESVLPSSTKNFDNDTGKHKWRVVNLTRKSDLDKRKNVTTGIKDGIERQDAHITEVFETGPRARQKTLIEERKRRKRRSP